MRGWLDPPSLTWAMFPTWLWRSRWPCVCKGQGSAERASRGRELPLLRWLITVIQIILALEGTSLCTCLPTLLASQPSAARHTASGFFVWFWGCCSAACALTAFASEFGLSYAWGCLSLSFFNGNSGKWIHLFIGCALTRDQNPVPCIGRQVLIYLFQKINLFF